MYRDRIRMNSLWGRVMSPEEAALMIRDGMVVGMSGFIANGVIHPHIMLATPDKAFGGHLEPGTTVFTFACVTIGVLKDGADLSRVDDKSYR